MPLNTKIGKGKTMERMIRIIRMMVLAAMMTVSVPAWAQYGDLYYHRIGDTIEQNPNNGFFMWWDWDYFVESENYVGIQRMTYSAILLNYNYTPVPLRIVGIAGMPLSHSHNPPVPFRSPDYTTRQEYFYLYESGPGGDTLLKQVPWNLADSHRYIHIVGNGFGNMSAEYDSCCSYKPWEVVYRLYEYYFDEPVVVTDSFYVGGSLFSGNGDTDETALEDSLLTAYYAAIWHSHYDCKGQAGLCYNNMYRVKCYPASGVHVSTFADLDTAGYSHGWSTEYFTNYYLIYPIIEVDTTLPPPEMCPELTGFSVQPGSRTCVMATWDSYPNYSYVQLRYGPISQSQGEWDTVEVTGNMHPICNIDTTASHYGFSARSICVRAKDTTEWTPVIWVDTRNMQGIGQPQSVVGTLTTVEPNPTDGRFAVRTQFPLLKVDVYNAAGILVYSEPATGHEHRVDLAGVPSGVYIVVVRTVGGSTVKRVVVER